MAWIRGEIALIERLIDWSARNLMLVLIVRRCFAFANPHLCPASLGARRIPISPTLSYCPHRYKGQAPRHRGIRSPILDDGHLDVPKSKWWRGFSFFRRLVVSSSSKYGTDI